MQQQTPALATNLLREDELASLLGLTCHVLRRARPKLHAAGLPQPLVSIGVDGRKPLWSLRQVDQWLARSSDDPAFCAVLDAAQIVDEWRVLTADDIRPDARPQQPRFTVIDGGDQ